MLRKKYKKEKDALIHDLVNKGRKTAILSIELKGSSKVENHMIYEVTFIDNCVPKTIPIVAIDVTQALGKLEPHLNIGIPEPTLKWMLGSERIR
jgi:polyribonucleotide nucleotidyltransferase